MASISFQCLNCDNRPAARDVLLQWWRQSDTSETLTDHDLAGYFDWRYGARGRNETIVAFHGERCIAALDSFIRPYWIGGQQIAVRETCDWYCLAEYRKFGIGLQLMRRMMAKQEPMLVINGSPFTVDLLPKLRWSRLGDVENFWLPVSVRALAGLALQRWWRAADGLASRLPDVKLRPRTLPAPIAGLSMERRTGDGGVEVAANDAYACAPCPDAATLDWFGRAPRIVGECFTLHFFAARTLTAVAACRVGDFAFGRKARIIHVHATRHDIIDWVLSETIQYLVRQSVGIILCRTSCPFLSAALKRFKFFRRQPSHVYWWDASKRPMPAGPTNFSSLRGDDALAFSL